MPNVRIAILTRNDDASPKVLAQGLYHMLGKLGVEARIFYGAEGLLRRLLPLRQRPRHWYQHPYRRVQAKLLHYKADQQLLRELRPYAAIVFCESIPNAFWRNYYDIESLRRHLPGIPILLYEVYYLGNAPTIQKRLDESGECGLARFDWHLAVSAVTEIRGKPERPWSAIGLDLTHTELHAPPKDGLVALVDFPQPGFERYRADQLAVLDDLNIPVIILQGSYSLSEIRGLYQRAALYFMQSSEAFGLPIAESLYAGAYVFTPDSAWPMSWRLNAEPKIHSPGQLPGFFRVYRDADDLRAKLIHLRQTYDPAGEPQNISAEFCQTYPTFCEGNLDALSDVVKRIERGDLRSRAS